MTKGAVAPRTIPNMDPEFDSSVYGSQVAAILALDQNGQRLMPLVSGQCSSEEARALLAKHKASGLFPGARAPEAARGGLFLYFSCGEDCHQIVQNVETPDGSFWHGIVHRQEPDAGNAAYWFRQTGSHAVFSRLARVAEKIATQHPKAGFHSGPKWDPFAFIDFCEQARLKPGSEAERLALEIQRAEWQILFDYCARAGA